MVLSIGFEGSANKLGIGIIKDREILSNVRRTFITPPGEGITPHNMFIKLLNFLFVNKNRF